MRASHSRLVCEKGGERERERMVREAAVEGSAVNCPCTDVSTTVLSVSSITTVVHVKHDSVLSLLASFETQ